MIDCYRDPTVLQFEAIVIRDAWNAVRRGLILKAARHVFGSPQPDFAQSRLGRPPVDQRSLMIFDESRTMPANAAGCSAMFGQRPFS
jgi:hypothetical protein